MDNSGIFASVKVVGASAELPRRALSPRRIVEALRRSWRDVYAVGACALLVFANYFKSSALLSWSPLDATLAGAVLVAAGLLAVILDRRSSLIVSPWAIAFVASFAFGFFVIDPTNSYQPEKYSALVLTLLVTVAGVYLLATDWRRNLWAVALAIIGAIYLVGVVVDPSDPLATGGLTLAGSNTISFGRAAGMGFVVAFTATLMSSGRARIALAVLSAIFGIGIVTSGSRGPLVWAAIAVVFFVLLPREGRRTRLLILGGAAVLGGLYVFLSGGARTWRIIAAILTPSGATESRDGIWNASWRYISEHPLDIVGVGWGNFGSILQPGERLLSGDRQYPHNVLLEIWVEGGVIPLIATVALIVIAFRRAIGDARRGVGVAAGALMLFAVGNAMISGDINDNRMMWISLAMFCAPAMIPDRRAPSGHREPRQAFRIFE